MRPPEPRKRMRGGRCVGWYTQIGGRQHTLGPPGLTRAQAWAALEALRARLGSPGAPPDPTAREVVGAWLDSLESRAAEGSVSRAYARNRRYYLEGFVREHGDRPARSIRPGLVEDWLASRSSWSSTTRAEAGAAIRTAIRDAVRRGLLADSPIEGLRLPPRRRRGRPPEGAYRELRAAGSSPQWRDLIDLIYLTGCRPQELYTLEARHVDWGRRAIRVLDKIRRHTGEERRWVPVAGDGMAVLRRLADLHPEGPLLRNTRGRPWTNQSVHLTLDHCRKGRGGARGVSAYTLRHLFVTDALARHPLHVVARLAGHKDMKTTLRYVHAPDDLDRLAAAAEAVRGGAGQAADQPSRENSPASQDRTSPPEAR